MLNATGPRATLADCDDPLLSQLLGDGVVHIDPLDIGLSVDALNRAGDRLWAMGALTKGRYWEMTAVPDIRVQAAVVAAAIAKEVT